MVILSSQIEPAEASDAASLSGAAVQCGQDLGTSVEWLNRVLGLQLLSLADDQGCALVATGLHRGAFRLELLAPPAGTPSGGGSPSGGSSSGTAGTFGHFCLAVPSTAAVLDRLRAGGQAGLILQECAAVTPVRAGGRTQTDCTSLIRDPSGFEWQLMELHGGQVHERLLSLMLRVEDLPAALRFYTGVLGMRVHQKYDGGEGYQSALVGFGQELGCTLLELRQERRTGQTAQQAQQAQQEAAAAAAPRLARLLVEAAGGLEAAAESLPTQGQAFRRLQLASSEEPAGVPALALTDPDGLAVCLLEPRTETAAGEEADGELRPGAADARAAEGAAGMVQLESGCGVRMEALVVAATPMEE